MDAVGVALWGWSYVGVGFVFAGSVRGASGTFGQVAVLGVGMLLGGTLAVRRMRAA
ncbi:MAG: hypothetical protein JWO02_2662 [Solirubrobacterales bacterium]|nr:hypothetical protein [Solirubrobacterales bacterium]